MDITHLPHVHLSLGLLSSCFFFLLPFTYVCTVPVKSLDTPSHSIELNCVNVGPESAFQEPGRVRANVDT